MEENVQRWIEEKTEAFKEDGYQIDIESKGKEVKVIVKKETDERIFIWKGRIYDSLIEHFSDCEDFQVFSVESIKHNRKMYFVKFKLSETFYTWKFNAKDIVGSFERIRKDKEDSIFETIEKGYIVPKEIVDNLNLKRNKMSEVFQELPEFRLRYLFHKDIKS